jgi:NAD+ kinase
MKVAIYSRGLDKQQSEPLQQLMTLLEKNDIEASVFEALAWQEPLIKDYKHTIFSNHNDLDLDTDCVISLGGDGTLLDTVAMVRNKDIPVLGINLGRLGFLSSIGIEELGSAVDALANGTFVADERTLIHVDGSESVFGETPFALNEFAIHKRETSSMIKIHTYLNGEYLNTYWADGLIVSTPTGSTGYNMSCGGPIVFPDSGSFVITPIAPHNLTMRPIVVPDNNIISFEVEGRTEQFICSLDARREIVSTNIQLAVKKEKFGIRLVRLNENNFLQTLRSKLTWGLDKRN